MPKPRSAIRWPAATLALLLPALLAACGAERPAPIAEAPGATSPSAAPATGPTPAAPSTGGRDPHSFARPDEVAVKHLDLDLTVDFAAQKLTGRAVLTLDRKREASELVLDTNGLDIQRVRLDGAREATFQLGDEVPFLGRALTIALEPTTARVEIDYSSRPGAGALQWLTPAQTAGKRHPFLFTQSQAILARTWVPCQDSPGIRMTYSAKVRVPQPLLAVMSAENPTAVNPEAVYRFAMTNPVPSYLLALGVGELEFRALGGSSRAGVYAEPPVVEKAAWEFADTEKMIAAAEALYGPYRWGRYDLLVLPPSFPYGGMENPRLTFATPTVIAGDRSLVSLVAHELAHSWSGNLVTNATWNDFWLNEGFTTYFESRIMEAVYGREHSEMLAALAHQDLVEAVAEIGPTSPDTHLRLNLAGRDPDEGVTTIPYDKGMFFLRLIEETVGREAWDVFLRGYFETFAFQSMNTDGFLGYLRDKLLASRPGTEEKLQIAAWVDGPGIPANCPQVKSAALARVDAERAAWVAGKPAKTLATQDWAYQQWVHFLRNLPTPLDTARMAELDAAFRLSESANSEVLFAWLMHAVKNNYQPARPAVERFLLSMGRRKFLRPLYQEMAKTPEGLEWARRVYTQARPTYHPVSVNTIDQILKWEEAAKAA
ncbi:MAG TPA: M1 family metallopeptidase [Thermoanaerobaculia bacterium]|nr:M1 family metallopeptidase [Thermoanaerobaculia bacterium]